MRIFNADGGEVESCGNAARCVGRLLLGESGKDTIRLETAGGPLQCRAWENGLVEVDMGPPQFEWQQVPLSQAMETEHFTFDVVGEQIEASALSMGNPHCVIFTNDAETAPVASLGPKIETHPLFPARVNVEFVSVLSPTRLRMRVWERGAGITRACGTGACAAAVAAARRGLAERGVDVVLDGGTLHIAWREADGHVLMTGPATLSFRGEIDLERFAP
jgi:diaminopimelate epimerase